MLALALCFSATSLAQGWSARLEGGAAIPLSEPLNQYYGVGGSGRFVFSYELASFLDVQGALAYSLFPASAAGGLTQPASTLALGAGLRVRRELADNQVIPTADVTIDYVRDGPLDRLGLSGTVALLFRPSTDSSLRVGPVAGVRSTFHLTELAGQLTRDALQLNVGLALEFGASRPPALTPPPPPPPTFADTDGDGLSDQHDKCPTKPGPASRDGCPADDADADGLLDDVDQCPTEAGPKASGGCPSKDTDGDGVVDTEDDCPTKSGSKEQRGCPVYASVKVTQTKLELNQKIFFAFGLTTILNKSYELLDEVTSALTDRSNLCVRIEGHTDSVGDAGRNVALSRGRARAVLDYLTGKGVPASRLTSEGYGATMPIDNNATADGRDRNRRVEFILIRCSEVTP